MKIIDLSTPFDFDYSVPQPPFTEPHTELKTINTRVRNAFYETKFTITSYSGTHLDVPSHRFSREEKDGVYFLDDFGIRTCGHLLKGLTGKKQTSYYWSHG